VSPSEVTPKSSPSDHPEKKTVFSFYNGYLGVIYGLLITDGLHYVVGFGTDTNRHQWNSLSVFLFLGTFLISLHFWYTCATVDDLSQEFYQILAGWNEGVFELLLLLDAVVATAFAGFMLAMFQAIPPEQTKFFLWFLCAAGLSLFYDVNSRFLVLYARRRKEQREQDTIQRYNQKVRKWITADIVFTIGSVSMYFSYPGFSSHHPFALGAVFATLTLYLLLADIDLWPVWGSIPCK
jgi:hypothetical protein